MAVTRGADGAGTRVAVLGPVLVEGRAGTLVEPSGTLGKSLMVALMLARGGALSVTSLIDDLWGDEPPRQAKAALQTLVSRVRAECADGLLVSTNGGYALAAAPDATDLGQATALRDAARASVAAGNHAAAEEQSSAALALWRAEPGVDLSEAPAADLRSRASTLRSELQRIRVESLMRIGRSAEAVTALEALAAAASLDEELQLLLMQALAAAGRRNDALASFARFRAALRDELGTSPGQQLVQFNAELLRDDPPAAPAERSGRVRIGLREAPNGLLGREHDLVALEELIRSSRLTTILGPGGLGKTRLAQELAHRASVPAVIVVELASVRSGDDVTLALGSTLGIREASGSSLTITDANVRLDVRERILATLGERETLLVMDNCEHVADAAAAWIADILASTTTVRILATSRSPLAISGESVYPLDSLASGDEESGLGPAGKLFIERALAARPGVTLPLTTITRLCTRLDGLPLAIELAAARVRSMSVEEIERRLNNRFALLTSGERTAPERHRTLVAVIDWSWNLLGESERALLRRLSRFPDGFSAEAAQVVGSTDGADVTDALDGLVTQSLVSASEDASTGEMRYRMLETVREFGEMALVDAGEDLAVRAAMAEWAETLAGGLMSSLGSSGQIRSFHVLALEQDNLVTVLRSTLDDGNADAVVTIFASLAYYWAMRGAQSDIAGFAGAVLRATTGYTPDAEHLTAATATYMIAAASAFVGDTRRAMLARGRLRAVKRIGPAADARIETLSRLLLAFNKPAEAMAILAEARTSADNGMAALGALLGAQLEENGGELETAIVSSRRAYDLSESAGDVWLQSTAAQALANLHSQRAETEQALEWAAKSRDGMNALQANGDLQQLSWVIAMNELRATPENARGTFESFVAQSDEDLGADFADLRSIGWAGLAEIALADGRVADGLALYRRSIDAFSRDKGRMAPWYIIVASACISAHVFAGAAGTESTYLEDLVRRVRIRVLVSSRTRREFMDLPVAGASLVGISAWLLSTAAPEAAHSHELGLRMLLLADVMGGRQDMPSLGRARWVDAAVAAHGTAAIDAARASVAGLSPRQAFVLACELLRDPTLRAGRVE
ncbi:ATP-binding protein [Parafrigoribacterium soli]|uniref:ATP-binding protein n=1 Tax=Parafrigoribacterium soli TaxID=3144663 RepID=UPI0032EAD074